MSLRFLDYQAEARKTVIYPEYSGVIYPVLGLNGEAGEVAGKVKKIIRDGGDFTSVQFKQQIAEELGDVLWYVAAICDELGLSMTNVAKTNLAKLEDRQKRDKLSGSGDDR